MSKCSVCKIKILEGDETVGTGEHVTHKACSEGVITKEPVEFNIQVTPQACQELIRKNKKN